MRKPKQPKNKTTSGVYAARLVQEEAKKPDTGIPGAVRRLAGQPKPYGPLTTMYIGSTPREKVLNQLEAAGRKPPKTGQQIIQAAADITKPPPPPSRTVARAPAAPKSAKPKANAKTRKKG